MPGRFRILFNSNDRVTILLHLSCKPFHLSVRCADAENRPVLDSIRENFVLEVSRGVIERNQNRVVLNAPRRQVERLSSVG